MGRLNEPLYPSTVFLLDGRLHIAYYRYKNWEYLMIKNLLAFSAVSVVSMALSVQATLYTGPLFGWDGEHGGAQDLSLASFNHVTNFTGGIAATLTVPTGGNPKPNNSGSTDGTYGSAITGASTDTSEHAWGVRVAGGNNVVSLSIANNSSYALSLETIHFDYNRAFESGPQTVTLYYWEGDLALPDETQINQATNIPLQTGGHVANYNDFDWSLTNLASYTLSAGQSALFRLTVSDADGNTTNGAFDNIAVSGTLIPEPSSMLLALLGLFAAMGFRRATMA